MMLFTRSVIIILAMVSVLSCGPASLQDYRKDGENLSVELLDILYTIDTREDAVSALPRLKSIFDQMVNLMISAREYRDKHPEADMLPFTTENQELNDRLRAELNRVFRIEDARDIIEKAQEDALNRLDANEKRHLKAINK